MRDSVGYGPPAPTPTARVGRPVLPPGVSWRSRLAEALDAGTRRAVTLICAGPGWGKTSLVASWAEDRAGHARIAWLTCDEGHNEASLFWSELMLALGECGVAGPDRVVDGPAFLYRLGPGPGTRPGPVVLVLDDLHTITEPWVLNGLADLLSRPPDWLRLLVITRTEPGLLLHRLRGAGELTELRARDLAFRSDEAAEMRVVRDRSMPLGRIAALVRETEGWAVGLRLALDAAPGVDADEAVYDYLIHDVLATEPRQVRDFLLRTSVPDRICGDLADALTARQSSRRLLEQLGRANLFIESVGTRRWFRYHRQFRAVLRRRLAQDGPDTVNRLHLLAAQWHAREGSALTALRHASAAGDWSLVARLVAEYGLTLFVSPDRAELVTVLRQMPTRNVPESAELVLCEMLLTYELGDVGGVPKQLFRARALLTDGKDAYHRVLGLALDLVEAATVLRWRGDMPRLVATTTGVLDELGRLSWSEVPAMPQYRAIALLNKGLGLLWLDRPDRADRYLWAAATAARAAGATLVEINALGLLAVLAVLRGSLHEAGEHVAAAIGGARRAEAQGRISAAPAYLAQAMIELEQGHEAAAEAALRHALHASGEQPEAAIVILTGAVRAQLLVSREEPESARAVLGKAVEEAGPALAAPLVERLLGVTLSEIELARADPQPVVTRYAQRCELYPPEQVRLAQAYQAVGRAAEAEALLAVVREGPDRVAAVSAWLLTALAADAQGHGVRAGEALARAVSGAEPDGIRRPFRRFGAERVSTLAEHQQWLTEPHLPSGEGVLAEITGEIPAIGGPAVGPLSEREIDVLQFLPTVLTAGEIAEILGISVNTVKAHMRSIYRKLGAGRRREAVVTARQLGLL